jgi:hypothetical protein
MKGWQGLYRTVYSLLAEETSFCGKKEDWDRAIASSSNISQDNVEKNRKESAEKNITSEQFAAVVFLWHYFFGDIYIGMCSNNDNKSVGMLFIHTGNWDDAWGVSLHAGLSHYHQVSKQQTVTYPIYWFLFSVNYLCSDLYGSRQQKRFEYSTNKISIRSYSGL